MHEEGAIVFSSRIGILVAILAFAVVGTQRARAATKVSILTKQKTVLPYRLVLKVGPPQMMTMRGMAGERMISGRMATCQMGSMKGMNMGGQCNHHVELHVCRARGGQVMTGARVTIVMRDAARRMTIRVPIMRMEDPRMDMADLHYGNNVHAAPGAYAVMVHVNAAFAVFHIHLR